MKAVVAILAVALVVVGVLYYQGEQTRKQAEAQNAKTVQTLQEQLTATSNQAVTASGEVTAMRTELAGLKDSVTTIGTEKTKADERAKELQERLATVEKDLADEKAKLAVTEEQRTKIVGQLDTVSTQLTSAKQQYAELQKSNDATTAELERMKDKVLGLEGERASLIRQLNDLDTLRAQIRLVKHQLWEKHIDDWKKRDSEASVGGNSGVLMKNGQWQNTTATKPAS